MRRTGPRTGNPLSVEQMRRTIETVGRIPEESLSSDVEHDLLEAFRSWTRG